MNPAWRLPLILVCSVVFGLPVLSDMALASGDLVTLGVRYVAALGLSWVGVSMIFALCDRYADENIAAAEAEEAAAAAEDGHVDGEGAEDRVVESAAA